MKKKVFRTISVRNSYGARSIILVMVPLAAAKNKRAVAVLHMDKLGAIGDFLKKMKLIRTSMKNNSTVFTNPPVLVADTKQFDTDIQALDSAETLALTKVRGSATARNTAKTTVLNDAHSLQGYVQTLADAFNNTEKAAALIESSGFDVSIKTPHEKNDFTATNTKISGTVKLALNVKKVTQGEKRFSVKWQLSADDKTWTDLPGTLKGTTTVSRLIHAQTYFFRFMVVLKDGEHGWSQSVELLVN